MLSLRQRVIRPELLDHAPEPDALRNLRNLVRINELLGGHGVLRRMLAEVAQPGGRFTVLDVGSAMGDADWVITDACPGARAISLDSSFLHVSQAAGPRICADGFRLPVRDGSVDFVLCSLFLHHFTDDEIIQLLREAGRVAVHAVLVNDLERRLWPWLFLPATRWLFGWDPITLHDGPVSVAAGFRAGELARLAREAGFTRVRERVHRPSFRVSLIASR